MGFNLTVIYEDFDRNTHSIGMTQIGNENKVDTKTDDQLKTNHLRCVSRKKTTDEIHQPVIRKSLKMDDKDRWKSPQIEFLECLLMLLARGTVPANENRRATEQPSYWGMRVSCSSHI